MLITRRTFYNCSCGGVAYVGIFDNVGDTYKPALVFFDMLGSGNEKYVAEAISHEAGHNMGLNHDGAAGTGYYQGHGSGATGWAPIMGVGYYQPLVQWSKGEYPAPTRRRTTTPSCRATACRCAPTITATAAAPRPGSRARPPAA